MTVIGIDLGTTFSAASIVRDGMPVLLPNGYERLIPSVVGVSPEGQWLVGTPALNQYTLYPDQTVRSIKRLMGTDTVVSLGGHDLSPQEVSALILREIKRIAEAITEKNWQTQKTAILSMLMANPTATPLLH